jgi:tetratricopeptide (TPR) repeat protein
VNSSRVRELNRLLNLLKSDPDEGLKFALPFGGESHRGQAPPSGRLARREVNFDLSRLRGGGPADFWNVPYQIQQQLREEYRRLANRELNLGRHRRAAYIFAELLGELPAAAGALVAGRHFREAAVLYQERLQQPLEAAKCLEQGGLWAEALQLYEKLGEFEKAGDLARRLEQFDDATRLYREAERAARSRHDYLAAARILEQKLDVADEALDCLTAGCRSAHEGRPCLAALFELLGRLGRHDIAREHVVLFRNAPEMRIPDEQFAGELAKIAQTYPDEPVRAVAADSVRIVVGARLTQATPDERYQLLLAVKTLAPEDRLLDRDCRRYIETHTRAISRNVAAANANKRIPEVTLVREYRLPEHVHWVTATSTDSWYYAAGYRDRELIAVRGTWSILHELSVIHWDCQPADASRPILLVPDPQENSPATFLHCPGRPTPVIWKAFYGVGQHDSNPRAGTPPWASSFTLAVARDAASNSWALNWTGGNASLNTYDANNAPLASRDLSILEAQSSTVADLLRQQLTLPIEVGESATYIGLGTCLAIVRKQANVEYVEMPHPIQGLSCSVPHTRNRVAVTFETGGQVFWDEPGHRKFEWFGTSLSNPQALFTNRGWLVAASSEECQVYSTNEGRMRLAAECRWTDRTLLALLKTGAADEFAVCCADGRILTYRVPENA